MIRADPAFDLFTSIMRRGNRIADMGEARDRIARAFLPHHWDVFGNAKGFALLHGTVELASLLVHAVTYNRRMLIDAPAFQDFLCMHFSVDGNCVYQSGRESACAGQGSVYVSGPRERFMQDMSADYKQVTVKVPRRWLERFLLVEKGLDVAKRPLVFLPSPQPLQGPLLRALHLLRYLCEEYDSPPEPVTCAYLERALMACFLAGIPNNYQHAFSGTSSSALPYYVARVDAYVHAHLREPMSLQTMVLTSGVGRRTLTGAFHRHIGMSPMTYLKMARLRQARAELENAIAQGRSVTEVALACGFNHLSKFAKDYALVFGESPSTTRRFASTLGRQ